MITEIEGRNPERDMFAHALGAWSPCWPFLAFFGPFCCALPAIVV